MKLKTFKTLQYNITHIFDVNSSNGMFCSMHDFISKTLFTFNLALILNKMRILNIPKLSKNARVYLNHKTFEEHGEIRKIKIHM